MADATTCPVCDWKIENPVTVQTSDGAVEVCCEECAQTLRHRESQTKKGARSGG